MGQERTMATTATAKADRSKTIEVGDFVTFGDNKLTWEVLRVTADSHRRPTALVKSGQSGKRIEFYLEHLVLFKKGEGNVD